MVLRIFKSYKSVAFMLIAMSLAFTSQNEVSARNLTIITGYNPPWSMASNSKHPGYYVEIIQEAQKRLGDKTKIKTLPWSRALQTVKRAKNTIIFPLLRSPHRENQYKWLLRIQPIKMVLVSYTHDKLTYEKALALKSIIVHKNAPPEYILREKGFNNLISQHDTNNNVLKLLEINRAEAWFTAQDKLDWNLILNPGLPEPKVTDFMETTHQYIAASKEFDDKLFAKFSLTLQNMVNDGTVKKIISRYKRKKHAFKSSKREMAKKY